MLIRYKEVVEAAVSRMQSEMQALKAERVGQAHLGWVLWPVRDMHTQSDVELGS